MTFRSIGSDAVVGVLGLAAILLVVALGYSGKLKGFFEEQPDRVVRAQFADSKQLDEGGEVRIDGVRVGEIKKISYNEQTRAADVEMRLFDDAGPLFEDATAGARFASLLGGRFYIDLERGTDGREPLAAAIPKARTWSQVEVDDITDLGRGASARGLRTLPTELSKGLRDPEPVAEGMQVLGDVSGVVARGVGAARGQDPDRDIDTLVKKTDATVSALDTPRAELQGVVSGAASLLQTTAAREADLRTVLRTAPATMTLADATLRDLDGTVDRLTPLVSKLEPSVKDVLPTVQRLRPLVRGADALLQRAEPLVFRLRPALGNLGTAAKDGLPLLTTLRPSIDRLEKSILPWLGTEDPQTGMTVSQAIGPGIYGLGGIAGLEDEQGHLLRFPVTSGNSSVYLTPCQTYVGNPDKGKLIACEALFSDLKKYLSYDPLGHAPGTADNPGSAKRKGRK